MYIRDKTQMAKFIKDMRTTSNVIAVHLQPRTTDSSERHQNTAIFMYS